MELRDQVAIVTGSSRGLGRATARELARRGARVVVNYVQSQEKAEAVAAELRELGSEAFCVRADVSQVDEAEKIAQTALDNWGRIDILVNNAGILRDRSLRRMKPQEWSEVIAVNLGGIYNCSRAALPHMLRAGSGRIVNVSSVVALSGNYGQTNYSASKAGVLGFTKSLALETAAQGITVNAVAPGFMRTDMLNGIPEDVLEQVRKRIPLGDFGEPDDVAYAVGFLVSAAARYITGQVIHVNGGLHM